MSFFFLQLSNIHLNTLYVQYMSSPSLISVVLFPDFMIESLLICLCFQASSAARRRRRRRGTRARAAPLSHPGPLEKRLRQCLPLPAAGPEPRSPPSRSTVWREPSRETLISEPRTKRSSAKDSICLINRYEVALLVILFIMGLIMWFKATVNYLFANHLFRFSDSERVSNWQSHVISARRHDCFEICNL